MLKRVADTERPYQRRNTSLWNQLGRASWGLVWLLLFRPTPRPFHAWRAFLLRIFGAKLGRKCHIYAGARIWAPWNLVCGDGVGIADGAEIYNPAPVTIGDYAVVSQGAFLCGASHDYNQDTFPMIWAPIQIGAYAWIAARSTVQMGVTVGEGSVLGLGAIATSNLAPWRVYAGIPARPVGHRQPRYAQDTAPSST
jgi:putative colanic acid biosynthesis acetyltransferase WcaF